jgi:hypothetical protein
MGSTIDAKAGNPRESRRFQFGNKCFCPFKAGSIVARHRLASWSNIISDLNLIRLGCMTKPLGLDIRQPASPGSVIQP